MPDILHEVKINGSPAAVYAALTENAGLAAWWTHKTRNARPQVGTVAEFEFPDGNVFKIEVTELAAGSKVHWKPIEGVPDWPGTRVTWDMEAADGGTKLLFGHRDYASYGGSFAGVSYNWAWFLTSLKQYIETGTGTPV
jgi:uncharacterized protein YndB with AHSA1/START domain